MRFAQLELPAIEAPSEIPELRASVFAARSARLEEARAAAGFDAIVIYADREHSANLEWLTGFSPRFEEALWVSLPGRTPVLLTGNENLGYAPIALKLEAEVRLYQHFSLPDQPRDSSTDLEACLRQAGLGRDVRVGLIGWKPMRDLEVPNFIVRALEQVTAGTPVNAAHLVMDAGTGLRVVLEPEMVRFCEYAARVTSQSMRHWVFALEPGLSERDAARQYVSYGLELGCHPMSNFARSIPSGLGSPRNRRAERGGYAQGAFSVIGSLTCRAGRLVGPDDADADLYLEIVENYLGVVRAWYAGLRVGASGGAVFAAADRARAETWDFALNPGHLIHLDEWVSSPFYRDSSISLRSGLAIQQDIIPVPRQGNAVINMEDGLVLADAELRGQLERLDPAMMERINARREHMLRLGYALHDDVLPLSDIAGTFFPFLLEPTFVARFD